MPAPLPLSSGAFCRPEDVRTALKNLNMSTSKDDVLIAYINMFSKMAEGASFCDREFLLGERTEYFDGLRIGYNRNSQSVRRIWVRAAPILETPSIRVFDDPLRVWGDTLSPPDTELTIYEDFHVDYENGIISFYALPWQYDIHNLKVLYTGGLVKDIELDAYVCPDDLRMACALQCAHWFKIANDPGAVQISGIGGGQVTMFQPTQILPAVKAILHNYRRFQF